MHMRNPTSYLVLHNLWLSLILFTLATRIVSNFHLCLLLLIGDVTVNWCSSEIVLILLMICSLLLLFMILIHQH
jgi:hypothetical protein